MLLPLQTHQPTMGVYQIELNEKRYIGSSSQDIQGRWESHLYDLRRGNHCNRHLQNAYNKYGEELLKFSVLEVVEIPEDCIIIEQKYIDIINPEDAYNICPIAGSRLGVMHTDAAKMKMSIAQSGHRTSEETRAKIGIAGLGRNLGGTHTEETKRKIGQASLGTHASEETKQKMSEANMGKNLGKKRSEESKKRMSLARLGVPKSEDAKAKMSLAKSGNKNALGAIRSEETKQKIRNTLLRRKEALIWKTFKQNYTP